MSLRGRRILVTRAEEDAASLKSALVALGAEVIAMPTIQRLPASNPEVLADAARRLPQQDMLAIGSLSALRPLVPHLTSPVETLVGCVGAKTAAGLDDDPDFAGLFVGPRVVPSVYRAEALVDALVARHGGTLSGRRILVPRAPQGRTTLVEGLRAAGAAVEPIITYEIKPAPAPSAAQWAEVQSVDAVLFLSGETLANFVRFFDESQARAILDRTTVAVIGPVAAGKAETLGIRVDVVPAVATQEALVDALQAHLVSLRQT